MRAPEEKGGTNKEAAPLELPGFGAGLRRRGKLCSRLRERSVRKRTFSAVLRTSVRERGIRLAPDIYAARCACVWEEKRKLGRAGLYPPRFARAYGEQH